MRQEYEYNQIPDQELIETYWNVNAFMSFIVNWTNSMN